MPEMELLAVQLGIRLNLYAVLRDTGAMTAGALALRAGIDERYARVAGAAGGERDTRSCRTQ